MNKVKLYDILDDESEIFKISLVEDPAVNIGMVYLSKDERKFIPFSTNEEKHIVYACVLRSDYPIYRFDGENEYYIRFSKKAVENLSKKFMINGFQNEWSTNHQKDVKGLSVVESWIVTDVEKDKTRALNMDSDIGVGDWIVGCYVNNDEVWERIKQGEFNGFSVEAFVDLEEVKKFNKDNNMKNESLLEEIKNIIQECFKTNFVKKEEDEKEKEIDDTPTDETKDEEKKEKCEVVDEIPTEEVPTEAIVEEVVDTVEEISVDPQKDLQEIIDALQDEVNALKDEIEGLKKENEKLSKQPSVKKLNVEASSDKKFPSFLDFASGKIKY